MRENVNNCCAVIFSMMVFQFLIIFRMFYILNYTFVSRRSVHDYYTNNLNTLSEPKPSKYIEIIDATEIKHRYNPVEAAGARG